MSANPALRLDIADAISLLAYLFQSGETPRCRKAADVNDDGKLNVSDAIGLLLFFFKGRGPLPEPFDACGLDPTSDPLDCTSFAVCQ